MHSDPLRVKSDVNQASTLPPILHLDDASTWRGGQQQVLYLHQGLLALGHDSRVICTSGGAFHARLRKERLPHYALAIQGAHDVTNAWRIGRLVRSLGAILHAHSSHAHELGLWARRLSGRFPFVVSRRVDFPMGRRWWSRRKYRGPNTDLYLAISSGVERELRAAGVDPGRIQLVPSGIDLSRFDLIEPDWSWRSQMKLRPGEILFGNVAALAPHKDQRTLLQGFARFRQLGGEAHLAILGDGELYDELLSLCEKLGLGQHVTFAGFVDDVLPRMKTLDGFVLSSYLEGLGTSILDAMALGLPVLATRTGGIPDAIEHDRTGLLVPPRDPEALANALTQLQRSAELRGRLGASALLDVRRFDVRRTVELSIRAYRSLHHE